MVHAGCLSSTPKFTTVQKVQDKFNWESTPKEEHRKWDKAYPNVRNWVNHQIKHSYTSVERMDEQVIYQDIKDVFNDVSSPNYLIESVQSDIKPNQVAMLKQFPPTLESFDLGQHVYGCTLPFTSEDSSCQPNLLFKEADGALEEDLLTVDKADIPSSHTANPLFDRHAEHDIDIDIKTNLDEILLSGNLLEHLFNMSEENKPESTNSQLKYGCVQANNVSFTSQNVECDLVTDKEMERRRRNNEASRRSRAEKKYRYQELQSDIQQLQMKNLDLQNYVSELDGVIAEVKQILLPSSES